MKNQIKFWALALGLLIFTFTSCENEDTDEILQETSVVTAVTETSGHIPITNPKILDQKDNELPRCKHTRYQVPKKQNSKFQKNRRHDASIEELNPKRLK